MSYLKNLIPIYGNNNLLYWYLRRCSLKFKELYPQKYHLIEIENIKNFKNIIKYIKIMIKSCFIHKRTISVRMVDARIISKLYEINDIIPISEIINTISLKMILNIFPKSQLIEIEKLSNV